jgi:hypothetical protein
MPTRFPLLAFWLFFFWAGAPAAGAFSPDGEAWLEALRDRMATGLGGQEAYLEALEVLASDPDAGCGDWIGDGLPDADGDPAWIETLRAVCPEAAEGNSGRRRAAGSPALDLSASQGARPAGAGVEPTRWSARGRAAKASLEATGRGRQLRKRSAGVAAGPFAAQWGHWDGALGLTRIGCVAGNRTYPREGGSSGSSGIGGPLASAYPGLDGLVLSARSGPWRAQTAGAWNRLPDGKHPGNASVTVRRDVGLIAAGLARSPTQGPDLRTQAFLARLEADPAAPAWLAVAGVQGSVRGNAWAGRVAAAASTASASSAAAAVRDSPSGEAEPAAGPPSEPHSGAFLEAQLGYRDPQAVPTAGWDPGPTWEAGAKLQLRQALGAWANPLQSPRGSLHDTVDGWAAGAPGVGGIRAETAFPGRRVGAYTSGLRAAAAADWAASRAAAPAAPAAGTSAAATTGDVALTAGRGEAAWIQAYGPLTLTLGAGFGWRRPGSAEPASDAGRAVLEWRRGPWVAKAAWSRRGSDYAGSRPMPLDLSVCRRPAAGKIGADWALSWSAADARRLLGAQRIELRQSWPGGSGIRVEQRLRVPWSADGIGAELAYQFGLEAEI